MRQMPGATRGIFVVSPLPPPLHGVSATTKNILASAPGLPFFVVNISPGDGSGLASKALKPWRVILACLALVQHRCENPTLYMTADGGFGILYNILLGAVATAMRYRIFIHHHSFAYIDRKDRLMSAFVRLVGARATHVVLCPAMGEVLRTHYPSAARQIEVSNAALIDPVDLGVAPVRSRVVLGFMSNLIVEKGLDIVINLALRCKAEDLPVDLLIAGPETDQRSRDLLDLARAELGESFRYVGSVGGEEKTRFFESVSTFVFATRYVNEAQPRAVLEALAHGVPVLTISRSCISSDVGAGGLCVPAESDFVDAVMPTVRAWCSDGQSLAAAASAAKRRGAELTDHAKAGLDELIRQLSTPDEPQAYSAAAA